MLVSIAIALSLADASPLWEDLAISRVVYDLAAAFDSDRQVVVVMGLVGGTAQYDVAAGVMSGLDSREPPERERVMVYDQGRGRMVQFLGAGTGAVSQDVWELQSSTWTEKMPAGPRPRPRSRYGMVYDSDRRVTILACGTVAGEEDGSTWEWNGTAWTERPGTSPPRGPCLLAYDPGGKRVLATVGGGNALRVFSWTAPSGKWTEIASGGPAPTGLGSPAATFDPVRRRIVFFGGDSPSGTPSDELWFWGGQPPVWTKAGKTSLWPAGLNTTSAMWDGVRQRMLMFIAHQQADVPNLGDVLSDLWSLQARDLPDGESCQVEFAERCHSGSCVAGWCCPTQAPCGPAANGQPCAGGNACGSGFCVDGVCCEGECSAACQSCNAGMPGRCLDLPAGSADPGFCPAPRKCDGMGVCLGPGPAPAPVDGGAETDATRPSSDAAAPSPDAAAPASIHDGPGAAEARSPALTDAATADAIPPDARPAGSAAVVARRGLYAGRGCDAGAPGPRPGAATVLLLATLLLVRRPRRPAGR